jgi:hypothetical protein
MSVFSIIRSRPILRATVVSSVVKTKVALEFVAWVWDRHFCRMFDEDVFRCASYLQIRLAHRGSRRRAVGDVTLL